MIEINGSYGEAGGQILRTAIALSAVTKKVVRIFNIRKGRKVSGLKEQHLQSVKAVADLFNAKLKGAYLGSTEVEFIPREIEKKKLNVKIGTAGSVGLLLQCVMLPCFFANHKVKIEIKGGGTFGLWSPNMIYIKNILLPVIKKMGFNSEMEIKKHGFFPKGGAEVIVKTEPVEEIKPLILEERGKLKVINGISIASNYLKKAKVAERTTKAAKQILTKNFDCDINIKNEYTESLCPGSGITLFVEFENCIIGYDSLGEKGKRSEKVGEEAANGLIKQVSAKATIDEFLSDQILPFLAFCKKESLIKIPELTKHAATNIFVIEKFLPMKFKVENKIIKVKTQKSI